MPGDLGALTGPCRARPCTTVTTMTEALVTMTVWTPLRVLPGWPEADVSGFHILLVCILLPLATAALFVAVGLTHRGLAQRRADEVAAGLADPADEDGAAHGELTTGGHAGEGDRPAALAGADRSAPRHAQVAPAH